MAKFNATVEFSLTTTIEPEGVRFRDVEDIEGVGEFEEQSYFGEQNVTSDGGSLSFEITADDEYAARGLIEEQIFEGQEVTDDNDFTWLVESLNVDLEEIEETLTVEEALAILADFIADQRGGQFNEVAKAADVVLQDHAQLGRRVSDLETRVAGLDEQIRLLSARLAQ